jgi:hypothetical protein
MNNQEELLIRVDQDARRALRWANRLFARVGKLETIVKAQAQQLKLSEKAIENLNLGAKLAEHRLDRMGAPQYRKM